MFSSAAESVLDQECVKQSQAPELTANYDIHALLFRKSEHLNFNIMISECGDTRVFLVFFFFLIIEQ